MNPESSVLKSKSSKSTLSNILAKFRIINCRGCLILFFFLLYKFIFWNMLFFNRNRKNNFFLFSKNIFCKQLNYICFDCFFSKNKQKKHGKKINIKQVLSNNHTQRVQYLNPYFCDMWTTDRRIYLFPLTISFLLATKWFSSWHVRCTKNIHALILTFLSHLMIWVRILIVSRDF